MRISPFLISKKRRPKINRSDKSVNLFFGSLDIKIEEIADRINLLLFLEKQMSYLIRNSYTM